jgi:hypothetical protein
VESSSGKIAAPSYHKVVVCSGHMIDQPGRPQERFPSSKEGVVRQEMARCLDRWEIGSDSLAICGGACGADILFAELCMERGARVRLLIPLPWEDFIEQSVRLPGGDWVERLNRLRHGMDAPRAAEVRFQLEELGPPPANLTPHERNNLWIVNTARGKAKPGSLFALLVWDEQPGGDGPGGTTDFREKLARLGAVDEVINPTKLPR